MKGILSLFYTSLTVFTRFVGAFHMSMSASNTLSIMARVGKIRPTSTTFLVCDIQEKFRPLIYKGESVISTAQYLTSIAKALEIPLIVTQQYTKAFGSTVTDVFENGQDDLNELISKGRVFEKKKFSMLTDEVSQCLDANDFKGRESFVLFGVEAHVCVQQTCLDLLELGKEVHIVLDGISSQQPYDREIALRRMENSGAHLTTAQSLAFMLMESSNHHNFKTVSKLTVNHMTKRNEFNENYFK